MVFEVQNASLGMFLYPVALTLIRTHHCPGR